MLLILPMFMACGSDDKKPDYVGKWYRDKTYKNSTVGLITVADVHEGSMETTIYLITGKYLDTSTMTQIYNVKKETERETFTDNNGIVTLKLNGKDTDVKYSVWDNNMLVFTDIKTGDLYSLNKVTDEIQEVINRIDQIAVYTPGLSEEVKKLIQ